MYNCLMKLEFALLCERAFVDDNKRLNIIQVFENIRSREFPVIHPYMTLVSRVKTTKPALTTFKAILVNPKGTEISSVTINPQKKSSKNQFICEFYSIPLSEPGNYLIKIFVNNKNVHDLPLPVELDDQ